MSIRKATITRPEKNPDITPKIASRGSVSTCVRRRLRCRIDIFIQLEMPWIGGQYYKTVISAFVLLGSIGHFG